MRIVITEAAGLTPIVLDNAKAVILAADDGKTDDAVPCIAYGDRQQLMHLAAVILNSIRFKLGKSSFDAVVKAARSSANVDDVTNVARVSATERGAAE